jgi:hypothetical protein
MHGSLPLPLSLFCQPEEPYALRLAVTKYSPPHNIFSFEEKSIHVYVPYSFSYLSGKCFGNGLIGVHKQYPLTTGFGKAEVALRSKIAFEHAGVHRSSVLLGKLGGSIGRPIIYDKYFIAK